MTLVAGYALASTTGMIATTNRLDAVDLALIAISATVALLLIYPDALGHVKILELAGLRFELRGIRARQTNQEDTLDAVRLVLSLVLPADERKHLLHLLKTGGDGYHGGYPLRTELTHLLTLGLISERPGRRIEDLRSNMTFTLSDYVELTDPGTRSARMVATAAAAAAVAGKPAED